MQSYGRIPVNVPKTLWAGVLALILLVALACSSAAPSGGGEGGGGQISQPTTGPVPQAQPTSTPAPEAPQVISRELRIVTNQEPQHLDWMDGNSGASTEHFRNSFVEPLTQRVIGGSELRGLAAESWETVDGNPAHWRFKIRRGIEFHNGETFDANAAAVGVNFVSLPERGMIYAEA
jgi:ABC-type transport system substrate-binding protein